MKREVEYIVEHREQVGGAAEWIRNMAERGLQAGPVRVTAGRPRRSLDQNAKLWPMLSDVSRQVCWHGHKLTPEEWKDVFTAGLRQQKAVPGIDGGFVVIGAHTSRMDRQLFGELIELIYAFGSEHGVQWSEPAAKAYEDYLAQRGLK